LRLTFGHLLGRVAQGVERRGDGLHGGECVISVAFVGDQLSAHCRRAQARRETGGPELGGGLTLAIDKGSDVGQQVREMDFHTLAPACRKGIEAGEPALQCRCPFAHGHPAPPEFTFGAPLAPSPQFFDGAGHTQPSGTALERFRRFDEQRLE
jgi:hypothetical protein